MTGKSPTPGTRFAALRSSLLISPASSCVSPSRRRKTVEALRARNVNFMAVPDTYYEAVEARLPGHGEDLARLQRDQILIDGAPAQGQGLLLQIFTETVIGPIFFEIIQRKGNEGFGEGNFRALFESIERDQIRRGVLAERG